MLWEYVCFAVRLKFVMTEQSVWIYWSVCTSLYFVVLSCEYMYMSSRFNTCLPLRNFTGLTFYHWEFLSGLDNNQQPVYLLVKYFHVISRKPFVFRVLYHNNHFKSTLCFFVTLHELFFIRIIYEFPLC